MTRKLARARLESARQAWKDSDENGNIDSTVYIILGCFTLSLITLSNAVIMWGEFKGREGPILVLVAAMLFCLGMASIGHWGLRRSHRELARRQATILEACRRLEESSGNDRTGFSIAGLREILDPDGK